MHILDYVPIVNFILLVIIVVWLTIRSYDWSVPVQDAKYLSLMKADSTHVMRISELETHLQAAIHEIGAVKYNLSIVDNRLIGIGDAIAALSDGCTASTECPLNKLRRTNGKKEENQVTKGKAKQG